ncbi:MAG: cell division protein ZapD [Methylophilaceae bacterium]|nr:cell division protein ZapD [Methylophilaceae bacterium]
MIHYEFPLNEKTRKFLRLEEIFIRAETQLANRMKASGCELFETLFNLMASASRSDLKVELIQELERQRGKAEKLIRTKKNIALQVALKKHRVMLEKSSIKPGFYFGTDKFLQEIKARSDSPFGILSTDFPEMQLWLQTQTQQSRRLFFKAKFAPFLPIKNAVTFLNSILRESAKMKIHKSNHARYEIKLDSSQKNDLVLVELSENLGVIPALSSNKYAININFNSMNKSNKVNKSMNFKIGVSGF